MSLRPIPFTTLLRRLLHELGAVAHAAAAGAASDEGAVYELPARKIWRGPPAGLDLGALHHGRRAATPLGPAAGPHTQLAQNLVASWLAGARILELKTVQVKDELVLPRPCIDMATVGYNVEWSQELRLGESAREYVKAAMLIEILRHGVPNLFALPDGAGDTVFDLSVGYDLAGIQSAPVQGFLDAMRDTTALVDELRAELPAPLARLGALPFSRELSGTVTLSTFHGCPPGEIEAIARWLMERRGLDVTIKLNPTLLGPDDLMGLLHDRLGYTDIEVPSSAFEHDATWDQMHGIVTRLRERAVQLGRGFGIKLTNTLVVRNHRKVFPASETNMYLSGAPLHVLALELAARFRDELGDALPISFSAGVDKQNVADTVACGFVPVTICSDLLQPGGYGRLHGYLSELAAQLVARGATDLHTFIAHRPATFGTPGTPTHNTRSHAAAVLADPRYGAARNARPPKKLDRTLATFDCLSCDKCIPVCPNGAIFHLEVERGGRVSPQIGILADACNDCGNCDVFCPEHGSPNLTKPRFHLTSSGYVHESPRDGLYIAMEGEALIASGRLGGRELSLDAGPTAEAPSEPLAADLIALARAALVPGTWLWAQVPDTTHAAHAARAALAAQAAQATQATPASAGAERATPPAVAAPSTAPYPRPTPQAAPSPDSEPHQ